MNSKANEHEPANVRTAHICVCITDAQLLFTTQQRTVLIIFPSNLGMYILAQMLSLEGDKKERL